MSTETAQADSLTPRQRAFSRLLRIGRAHVLSEFDFIDAAQLMIRLEFGWVPTQIKSIRAKIPNVSDHQIVFEISTRSYSILQDLLLDACNVAVKDVEQPDWFGEYMSTAGFTVLVRRDGVINAFFAPVEAATFDTDGALYDAFQEYDSIVSAMNAATKVVAARQAAGQNFALLRARKLLTPDESNL